jgi:DNA recombination protein RmuC
MTWIQPITMAVLLALAAALGAALTFLFFQRSRRSDSEMPLALAQLQHQVIDLAQALHDTRHQIALETGSQLQVGTKALTDLVQSSQSHLANHVASQSREVAEKVGALHERLAKLNEEIRHLSEMGRDLRSLQDILRSPKVRGGFGEQLLETLLGNVLPASDFELQHAFISGEKVDAAIRLPGGLVPVDAKFPLENFQRLLAVQGEDEARKIRKAFQEDVRRHGRAIAAKYIRPAEGTLDLALMYVPAENVYYEAFVSSEGGAEPDELWNEMLSQRVFPVSPNTFSLYLSTVQMGLRGMRIEEGAKRIVLALSALKGDLSAFRESFDVLGRQFLNAARNLDEARRKLEKLEWKLDQVELDEGEAPSSHPVESAVRTIRQVEE